MSTVTDWNGNITAYTYDVNNQVTGVTRADGTVTAMVYDNAHRVISSTDTKADGTVICGFEYTYDANGRISTEKDLVNNNEMCYTYDSEGKVTKRTDSNTEEEFEYDIAGNILSDGNEYDSNNRLTVQNGQQIQYDNEGNMLFVYSDGEKLEFAYDSHNRLVGVGDTEYIYNAQDVRIKKRTADSTTEYIYDTNARLSRLLVKTTDGVVTKYVYGAGLLYEQTGETLTAYHFDYRGSTVVLTDATGTVTDTFTYDTYGKLTARTGNTDVIFKYNGRDGVITEENGLYYMRARYYCPEIKRFINADIIAGNITDAVTLNRFAYANCNPVSFVDPFGLSPERGDYGYGTVYYNGDIYSIYVPDNSKTFIGPVWETIDILTPSKPYFDFFPFLSEIEIDDMDKKLNIYNSNINPNKEFTKYAGVSIIAGIVSSFNDNVGSIYTSLELQKSGNKKRVIIKAGSSDVKDFYNKYANNIPNSTFFSNAGSSFKQACISTSAANLYTDLTGIETNWYDTYDVEITVDKAHKGDEYCSYLWVDESGTVMEHPILYNNDKIAIGKRTGLFNLGFNELLNISMEHSTPAHQIYQSILSDKGITLRG